jgi:hypothetical protein
MKRTRVFQKPSVSPTIAKEVPVRNVKGHFTGEKIVKAENNPAYHPATMDNVVCPQGAHPNTGWRGMKGHKAPSENGNTYVGRQRSGRISRNFGTEGKVAMTKGNAASFADSSPARKAVLTLKAKTMNGGESDMIGEAAMAEMLKRLDRACL